MRHVCLNLLVTLILGAAPAGATLAADRISTWIDAQGVRHFSQYPPPDAGVDFAVFELEPLPPAAPATDRLEAMRAVTRELELSRQARAEARAAAAPDLETATPPAVAAEERQIIFLPYPYRYRYPAQPVYPGHPGQSLRKGDAADTEEPQRRPPSARIFSPP